MTSLAEGGLETTRKLVKTAAKELGKGFVELIVADGLYMTKEDFKMCRDEVGTHLVVKTPGERLDVVKDARQLFYGNPKASVD